MLLFIIILICGAFVFTLFFQGVGAIAAISYYLIKGIVKMYKRCNPPTDNKVNTEELNKENKNKTKIDG